MNNLKTHTITAAKWSSITEILAKLITPITNMILARILAPEAFGVVATITMIISFADMFTDAGFQKYIVQHEFESSEDMNISLNVSFWSNFVVSLILWLIIIVFSNQIAILVGNSGMGYVISIACIQLPLTSFSSIQMAIYRRNFDFKTLFLVRIMGVFIPLIITIPLALKGYSYWSLIIGTICNTLLSSIILTIRSYWKPKFTYNISVLKEILSFSIWTLIESISIWLTTWIDSFIIGLYLNEYYLGLYKTSVSLVNSILGIITAAIIPVLFSTLCRLQNDEVKFKDTFYNIQKIVAYLTFPMGIGIYIYRDLLVKIFLGSQWSNAGDIIGIWALTTIFTMVFSNFNSEAYRAKGKPKISFISQIIHLIFLIPVCLISLNQGFWKFVYARSFIRFQGVITGFIIMKIVMNFNIKDTITNIIKPLLCSIIMGVITVILKLYSTSIVLDLGIIFISISIYIILIRIFDKSSFEFIADSLKTKLQKHILKYELNKDIV